MQGDLTHLGNAVEPMVGEKQHLALPMIVVLEQHNAHQYQHLIDEMFRLRARIFRYRLNWDVEVTDGKERDRYDSAFCQRPARRFWLTFSLIHYRTR
jgi:hypothetical protein